MGTHRKRQENTGSALEPKEDKLQNSRDDVERMESNWKTNVFYGDPWKTL